MVIHISCLVRLLYQTLVRYTHNGGHLRYRYIYGDALRIPLLEERLGCMAALLLNYREGIGVFVFNILRSPKVMPFVTTVSQCHMRS
jgi:hypothetical protein